MMSAINTTDASGDTSLSASGGRPGRLRNAPRRRRPRQPRAARWLLISPLILFVLLLAVVPTIDGLRSSFEHHTLLSPTSSAAGFSNYHQVLTDGSFWGSVEFTIIYMVIVTTCELIFGFALALLLDKSVPGQRFFISAIITPIMIAPALMGVMFSLVLNDNIGIVPAILGSLGIHIALLSAGSVVPMLLILDIVQWTPFTFLLFYAGLQSIPVELSEAAQIDGASYMRYVWSILMPLMTPTIAIAAFLRSIDAYRTFDTINVLTAGGPGEKTTTLSIYIYKILAGGDFSLAAAAATLMALIVLPFVPFVTRRVMRGALS